MGLDPALLKLRWGVTDPALDPLVDQVAKAAQAICEGYCDHMFDLAVDAEDFAGVATSCQLRRYPVTRIIALYQFRPGMVPDPMAEGAAISYYGLNARAGILSPAGWPGGIIHVDYEGGFEPWPPDLTWAVTQLADILWADTPGGGAAVGSAGGSGLGAIKKLSVVGVYSAELDTGSSGGGAGGGGNAPEAWGVLPAEVTAALSRFRTANLAGVG